MIRVTRFYPGLPSPEAGFFLAPAQAAYLAQLADALNWCWGWKLRPVTGAEIPYPGNVLTSKPIAVSHVHRIRMPSSPQGRYVWLVMDYQASRYPESGSDIVDLAAGVWIEVTLKRWSTGAVLDGPSAVRWDEANGTLPVAWRRPGDDPDVLNPPVAVPAIGGATYPILRVTTGIDFDPVPGALPTLPRPLNIPPAVAGAELLIEIETSNVRLIHVDAGELYLEQVVE